MMAHGDARDRKWKRNWRMEWVANTLHTASEHGVSSITTADAHTSAASIRLNWRPRRFKWTRPFRRKTKSGFCACALTFQLASTCDRRVTRSSLPLSSTRRLSATYTGVCQVIWTQTTKVKVWMRHEISDSLFREQKVFVSPPHKLTNLANTQTTHAPIIWTGPFQYMLVCLHKKAAHESDKAYLTCLYIYIVSTFPRQEAL